MQKTCDNRFFVKLQIRKDNRYTQRMHNIWLPRLAHLIFVRFACCSICLINHTDIIGRMVFMHTLDKPLKKCIRSLKFLDILYFTLIHSARRLHLAAFYYKRILIGSYLYLLFLCHFTSPAIFYDFYCPANFLLISFKL